MAFEMNWQIESMNWGVVTESQIKNRGKARFKKDIEFGPAYKIGLNVFFKILVQASPFIIDKNISDDCK
jgi:hypothetical protein